MLSRVADSLYWMSRFLERAEHTARAIDVQLQVALDEAPASASTGWVCLLNSLRTELPAEICSDDRAIASALLFDRGNSSSVISCVEQARENARQIREQITSDVWEEINRLYLSVREMDIDGVWRAGPHGFLRRIQRGAQLLAGVADSTMNHGEGWQFIRLGRFVERGIGLAWLLDAHFGMRVPGIGSEPTSDDFVIWSGLLRTCTAFEPYCKVHTADLRPQWILQFLLFSPDFPHSIRFCAAEIEASIDALAEDTGTLRSELVRRLSGRLHAELGFRLIDEVIDAGLSGYLDRVVSLCVQVHNAVYDRYISYAIDAALRGNGPRAVAGY